MFAGTDLLTLLIHERAKLGLTLAWQEPAQFEGITVREYLMLGRAGDDPALTRGWSAWVPIAIWIGSWTRP